LRVIPYPRACWQRGASCASLGPRFFLLHAADAATCAQKWPSGSPNGLNEFSRTQLGLLNGARKGITLSI
jgi:hypothetical protein